MIYLRKKPLLQILIAFTAAEAFRHIGWMMFYEQFINNSEQEINIGFIYYTLAIMVVSFLLPAAIRRFNCREKYQLMGNMYFIFFMISFLLRIVLLFSPLEMAYAIFFMSTASIEVCIMISLVLAFQMISPSAIGRFSGIAYFTDSMILTSTEHFSRTKLYFPICVTISGILCILAFLTLNNRIGKLRRPEQDFHRKPISVSIYRLGMVILIIYVLIAGLIDNLYFFEEAFNLPSFNRYILPITGVMYLFNGFIIDKIDRKISLVAAFALICIAQSMQFFVNDEIFGLAYTLISNIGSTFLELITLIVPMIYISKKETSMVGIGEGMFYGSFCITSILFFFLTQDAYVPIMGIILIGGVICLNLLISLIMILHNNELMESQLRLQNICIEHQRAVIVSLKKQINAHFTVNALNTVRALIKKKNNERAEEICEGLSGLLQYANAGDEGITVLEEFSMLERYLAIMHTRYPGKFATNLEFADELADVKIPRMLLQPVVENAILHGFQNRDGGCIHILCEESKNTIRIQVSDDGCGMKKETLEALREHLQKNTGDDMMQGLSHVALPNIQKRIQASFGMEYGVTIESELGKGTRVTLNIPNIPTKS